MNEHQAEPSLVFAADSDVGRRRSVNQDRYLAVSVSLPSGEATLLSVADGMGGAAGGEVASAHAVEELARVMGDAAPGRSEAELLAESILAANRAIFAHGQADPSLQGMGTTMVSVLVRGDQAVVAHVGDSRACLVRANVLYRLTADHNWVAEQVRRGEITEDEAATSNFRNVLTRSVGVAANVTPEVSEVMTLYPGDVLVLCSDGLHGVVEDDAIAAIAAKEEPGTAVRQLIDLANQNGGPDNITVVVGRMAGEAPVSVPPPSPRMASKVPKTERVPAAALMAPSAVATAAAPAAAPPVAPLPAAPQPAAAPAPSSRDNKGYIIGGIVAALVLGVLGAIALGRGGKTATAPTIAPTRPPEVSAPAAVTAPATVVASPSQNLTSPAAGGVAGTATPPGATPSGTAPPSSSGAGTAILSPLANTPECRSAPLSEENVRLRTAVSPCRILATTGTSASEIEARFGVTPACLFVANQKSDPLQPLGPLGATASTNGGLEVDLKAGDFYRLVARDDCVAIARELAQAGNLPAFVAAALSAVSPSPGAGATPARPPASATP
ncbi:MAG: Stp1/IreP family PP2C-type Ser/Thr phosphatase [Chloroflexi bacterium]|nr:Stp1/IreP family PP2C-type Ser/Thr phosphatase [Chloroflexota bacterium]